MVPEKKRLRLILAYDGSSFSGWQSQAHQNTAQDALEKALAQMTGETIRICGSSRTDAGVHALAFVAHFDTASQIPLEGMKAGLNALLPPAMIVTELRETDLNFHARNDAKAKLYRYLILNRKWRDPFRLKRCWLVYEPLDVAAMQRGAACLVGKHDFSCFQAADPEPRNPLRTLTRCEVAVQPLPEGGNEISIELKSQGFLKYMARNIVGTLVEIGKGKRSADCMTALLASKDRKQAGETAPAEGLYLVEVDY